MKIAYPGGGLFQTSDMPYFTPVKTANFLTHDLNYQETLGLPIKRKKVASNNTLCS